MSIPVEELVAGLLFAVGDDPNRPGVKDTPARVVRSWRELFSGYRQDPDKVLGTRFEKAGYDQMIVCHDIEFFSHCEHHLLPFFGKAHVGYIPSEDVVGLSKLARLVDVFARRLQIQERMTEQVAETIDRVLKPLGVIVVLEARHFCMASRGVGKQNSEMVTSAIRGAFKKPEARAEFMSLIGR